MELAAVAQLVESLVLIVGLVFAAVQLRQYWLTRQRESAFALVQTFQTPDFVRGLLVLAELPEGLTKREIEEHLGTKLESIWVLMDTWESLGVLVFYRELSLRLLQDFFSGPVLISWKKLHRYVYELRQDLKRDTYYEWFQWLAELIEVDEKGRKPPPAYEEHRDWTPEP